MKMMATIQVCLILLYGSITVTTADGCPEQCTCNQGLTIIHCEDGNIINIPELPSTTIELYLDKNHLTQLHNQSFVGLKNIEIISLVDNEISELSRMDFKGAGSVKIIKLAGNRLTSLTDDVFEWTRKIESLDLSRNSFMSIPDHSLQYLPHLQVLNMSHNALTTPVLGPGFRTTTKLETLDLSGNNLFSVENHAFHAMTWWEGNDIFLNLSECNLKYISSGAFSSLHQLAFLDLSGNTHITFDQLKMVIKELEISALKVLVLSRMNLTDISDLFEQLQEPKLEYLDLSHNSIQRIPLRAFYTLGELTTLDLSYNKMEDVGHYRGLRNLMYLYLSQNRIANIDYSRGFEDLQTLRALDLDHNELSIVTDAPFENMYDLEELNLSFNNISDFQISSAFEYLKRLNIASNKLTTLGSISRLRSLEKLDVSDNYLTRLDKGMFYRGRKLFHGNFSHNAIREIDNNTFMGYTPQIIDLSHNRITNIDNLGWTIARSIHLQGNYIQKISNNSLSGLLWLKYLDLSNNTIDMLSFSSFRDLAQVETLSLSNNRLGSFFQEPKSAQIFGRDLPRLQKLDISANKITDLQKDILSNLTSLMHLNLSTNRLTSLAGEWLEYVDVQFLDVSENSISAVQPEIFSTLSSLQKLDMSRNPFMCNCDLVAFREWIGSTSIEIINLEQPNYYECAGPYSWKGTNLMNFQVHNNCKDPVDKRIILAVIGCTAFAIFLIAGIIFYQHRWRIKRKLARNHNYRAIYDNNGRTGMKMGQTDVPETTKSLHDNNGARVWV